jgi:PAS domain S-box-containing protein
MIETAPRELISLDIRRDSPQGAAHGADANPKNAGGTTSVNEPDELRPRVLIVEDSQSLAMAMAFRLWNAGYEVVIAPNRTQALDHLQTRPPELLMLDYVLPDVVGLEFFEWLRREHPALPLVMVTGRGSEQLADRVLADGARDYVVKSDVFLEILPAVVGRVLAEDRIRRELDRKENDLKDLYLTQEIRVAERTAELARANERLRGEVEERRKAEAALRESENKYRMVTDFAREAIVVAQDGLLKFANPQAEILTGYSLEEMENRPFDDLIHPEDREMVLARHRRRLAGEPQPERYEYRVVRKNGQERWVELKTALIQWQGRPATLNYLDDITDRKNAERHLKQAQKMEAMGALAGGIAHDFNNILGVIIGNSELAQLLEKEGRPVEGCLEQILGAAYRAKNLVGQILTFSRKTSHRIEPVDIRPIVKEAGRFLRSSLPSTIEVQVSVPPDPAFVQADATQIHQVLMNLGANAGHAMRDNGGLLTIRLEPFTPTNPSPSGSKPADAKEGYRLTVADTGHGIEPDILERMFEPYFTTKEPGEGTGLGLAVVHGVAQSHQADIRVFSEVGRGTRFEMDFSPADEAFPAEATASLDSSLPKGWERILLVDDEPSLIQVGRNLLSRLGYQVTGLTSSREAWEQFQADPDAFDLVITDQTMPEMTGFELCRRIRGLRPDLPVVLCTGYSRRITEDIVHAAGLQRLLMKPLEIRDVARVIREVLDDPPVLIE